MSWQEINQLLGLALVDADFCQKLLTDPLQAVNSKGFDLTAHEQEVISNITASDIHKFCQHVIVKLSPSLLESQEETEQ